MKMLRKLLVKGWVWIVIIVILLGAFTYRNNAIKTKAKSEKTYTIALQDLTDSLTLSGSIAAKDKAIVRFQSAGTLSWVGVKEGDYVQKYQPLASLDSRDIQNRFKKYLNTYSKTRAIFD